MSRPRRTKIRDLHVGSVWTDDDIDMVFVVLSVDGACGALCLMLSYDIAQFVGTAHYFKAADLYYEIRLC